MRGKGDQVVQERLSMQPLLLPLLLVPQTTV
jgi:hypothetical protein